MRPSLAIFSIAACLFGCSASAVRPPGFVVPDVASDTARLASLDAADGVERRVWRTNGFSEGMPATYWDFGPTGEQAMPLYVLCRRSGSTCTPLVDHPRIARAMAGSTGYSPFGWIHEVPVTGAYAGEVLDSERAVEDARSAGLVEEPVPTLFFVEIPQVHPDVEIELGPDDWATPNAVIHAEGFVVPVIDFSVSHPRLRLNDPMGLPLVRNVYLLLRPGDTMPISERARGVDFTGDGDLSDSNSIIASPLGDPSYTPLWTMVMVTVAADYASIDTSGDEGVADYRSASDMFTIAPDYTLTPIPGRIVDFEIPGPIVNCPVQSALGEL